MHPSAFQHSSWYYALTLAERFVSLRQDRPARRDVEVDADLAARRLQRWRSQDPFMLDGYFARRLAVDGMTEDDLRQLLGEPIKAVHARSSAPPDWLVGLARAFSRPPSDPFSMPEAVRGQELEGFLGAIKPLISQGRDRVCEEIAVLARERDDPPFDRRTVEEVIYALLPERLIMMLSRAMALELRVARLQGTLKGGTPEERFRSFLERMRRRDEALAFLQEYPVLTRQLLIRIDHWAAFSLEFLGHLCADWEAIRDTFGPEEDPGPLIRVEGGGDVHRGGREVLVAEFGSGLRVVYKPRTLAVDVHFQQLLTWINERGDHPPFRTLKILDRQTYGWVEFVEARGCTATDEVRRFYRRQGGYLALLYALEATDFHFENLIAAGEHPVLIDLEALFHPRIDRKDISQSELLAGHAMAHSVLRVGLLPQRFWSKDQSEGVDVSGLGAVAGQLTPQPIPFWEGTGTDALRLARKRFAMSAGHHRPSVGSEEARALDYAEEIVAGFTAIYCLLLDHRDDLLSAEGPLAWFAEDEIRVILRPTLAYASMLRESYHPDLLSNALDRDRFFDRLWAEVKKCPELIRVVPAEREDLLRGDIPMLKARPNSRDLWSSLDQRIPNYFDEPEMAAVQRHVLQMCDKELTRQLWMIRASLATLSRGEGPTTRPGSGTVRPHIEADRENFLDAARAIGDHLESLALRGEHEAAWIGLVTPLDEQYWALLPLGLDLYDGHPGVVLFLAYLAAMTGEGRYKSLAESALVTLRDLVERGRPAFQTIGSTNGWGGVIYTYAHAATVLEQPALLAEAEAVVELLPPLIDSDEHLDLTRGAAGCITGLLSLYHCSPSAHTLDAAVRCGDHLLARARAMDRGMAWVSKIPAFGPLAGFAHGAAGIAFALGELADRTGEERFRRAERAAVAYERSLFSAEAGNWPDLRDRQALGMSGGPSRANFMCAWCHGAPGIGLARLQSLGRLDEGETRLEIEAALQTTLARGFGDNHSLCHGDLGNLELLLQAGERLGDPRWRSEASRMAAIILGSIHRNGWFCGVPAGVETPGLLTGLAGIGYGLLRLAEPKRVPSVLVLEPPIHSEFTRGGNDGHRRPLEGEFAHAGRADRRGL